MAIDFPNTPVANAVWAVGNRTWVYDGAKWVRSRRCTITSTTGSPTIYTFSDSYITIPGTASNYMSTPDAAALDITGDIDIRARVAMTDWTPSALQAIIAKRGAAGRSYQLNVNTDGTLQLVFSANGTVDITRSSTVATGLTDGTQKWVRATLDVVNPAATGHDAAFYLSDDGVNWTQLGTTVTTAGTTSIANSSVGLFIGCNSDGGELMNGTVYRAQVYSGIGGSLVFDLDPALAGTASTFLAATGQTITITGTLSRGVGPLYEIYKYTGSGNLVVATAGWCRIFAHAGGASGGTPNNGSWSAGPGGAGGCCIWEGWLEAGTYTIVVGAAGTNGNGGQTTITGPTERAVGNRLSLYIPGGGKGGQDNGNGQTGGCNGSGNTGTPSLDGLYGYPGSGSVAGGIADNTGNGITSDFGGVPVLYGIGGSKHTQNTPAANLGWGGKGGPTFDPTRPGSSGVVMFRFGLF